MGRSQRREGRKEPMRNPGIQEDLQAETKLQGTGLFPGFMASLEDCGWRWLQATARDGSR